MRPFRYLVVTYGVSASSWLVEHVPVTDGFILLVKVIYVAIEYLDEKLDGYSSVHTSIGDPEGTLEAL